MAGKYRAYPEYKDSGVEWFGEIPDHWSVSKVKFLTSFQVGWTPPTKDDANFEGENLWANISDLRGREISETNKKISDDAARVASMDISPSGSLLYSFKLSVGTVSFAGKDMYTNEAIATFLSESRLPLSYLYYVLPQFVIENASTNIYGARILNQELIRDALLLSPTYDEATVIANFLDHETAKIDTLIEQQQQLIQLLKEKRQAVISHAVTKGLNPDVPMKDSGVEWLGEVPAGWVVMQIRRILPFMEQGKSPECESRPAEDNEWGVLKTSCVNHAEYRSGENKFLPDGIAPFPEYEVKVGDVLMSRASGSIDLIGSVAYVFETRPKILLSDKIFRLGLSKKISGIFFKYLMQSSYMRTNIRVAISGAEGMANNITKGSVLSFVFALPNLHEQSDIVKYLDKETALFAALLDQAERMVSLLHERRTALISAAVTGKIDVRLHASRPTGSA
jgi:type I restriction enzyme S subunit